MSVIPLTTTVKHVTGGLLPLAIMTTSANFKTLNTTAYRLILKANSRLLCLNMSIVFTYWYIYDKNINGYNANNDYKITDVSSKEFNENDATYLRCTNITNPNDPAKLPTFA